MGYLTDVATAQAAPCAMVTLTGTAGGPQQPFNGLASAGTLVRYGKKVTAARHREITVRCRPWD